MQKLHFTLGKIIWLVVFAGVGVVHELFFSYMVDHASFHFWPSVSEFGAIIPVFYINLYW